MNIGKEKITSVFSLDGLKKPRVSKSIQNRDRIYDK